MAALCVSTGGDSSSPYMYRSVITPIEHPRGDLDGCVRVYPAPGHTT